MERELPPPQPQRDSHAEELPSELLDRYRTGECSAASAALVREWLARNPRHAARLNEVREIADVAATTPEWDTPRAWWRLQQSLGVAIPQNGEYEQGGGLSGSVRTVVRASRRPPAPTIPTGGRPLRRWLTPMAVGLSVVALSFVSGVWTHHSRGRASSAERPTTYNTANAQRATITLPDGSLVMLNVASRLEVPADFASGDHTLRLHGEALFTVGHRSETPFTVIAGDATARVLGTTFAVRHYDTDSVATVAVRDGKVAVRTRVLGAAQQLEVNARGVGFVHAADPARFGFATGTLTFNGTSLRDVVPELSRWYDAEIRLGDPSLGKRHIVGEFANASLSDLAAILELTLDDVRVVRHGRIITLYPK